jgi:hypothetical protein
LQGAFNRCPGTLSELRAIVPEIIYAVYSAPPGGARKAVIKKLLELNALPAESDVTLGLRLTF